MFLKKLVTQKVGMALAGAGCLAVTAAFTITGNTQQVSSDAAAAKTTAAQNGFQSTEFAHVEVRSMPGKSAAKGAPQSHRSGSAWIYEEPGTPHQPQTEARAGTRDTKPIKSEKLPGGGVILHLDRNLMYSSKAHIAKNGEMHFDCDKADHRH